MNTALVTLFGLLATLSATGSAMAQTAQPSPAPVPEGTPPATSPSLAVIPAPPAPTTPPVSTSAPPPPNPTPSAVSVGERRAPEEPPPCKPEGEPAEGAGMFFFGAGWFDFSDLNRHLHDNGYSRIRSPVTLIGGEGHAVMPSGFVMGARGAAILSPDGSGPDGVQRSFGGGFGMVDLGYAFVRSRPLLVSVLSSIGGYGMEIGIGDGQGTTFDAALQNPRRSTSIGRGGLLVGLVLAVDGRVALGPVDMRGGRGFFTFGARVGGLYGPPLGDWHLAQGGDATSGPGPGLAGFYAALTLGFGGGRDQRWR